MKMSVIRRVALIAIILIVALAMPMLAANIRPTGVTAGTGGLQTKGGELGIMTVGGDYLYRIVKGTGAQLLTVTNPAGGSANPWDYTATLGAMNGNDDFTLFDVNITNADHTGSGNTVQVMDIAAITGDAHATETAIKIGAGWDAGISCASPVAFTDTATIAKTAIVNEATATRLVTAADYGSIIACSYGGATTITLPDPSADTVGATFYITQLVDHTLTIVGGSTANNNNIIADGVRTADNVSFSTASHKIGAMCRVVGISATKWLITNASSCAMTVGAAD